MDTMTRGADEQAVLSLEHQFWQAMKDRNADVARRLTDDACLVAGPQGFSVLSAEQLAQMVPEAKYELLDFHIGDDARVLMLGKDVAVVAYRVHEDLVVAGEDVSLDAAETSTWIRRNGQWRCAQHAEALLGDPFGRDRVPADDDVSA